MEVCSMHHAESQGYEMRVSSLLETLPEYKNYRKTHPKGLSPCQGSTTPAATHQRSLTPPGSDMKRTHSERDGNLINGTPSSTSCLTSKLKQKLTAHVQCSSAMKSEKCELQTSCNNNSALEMTDCQIFLGGSCNPTSWRKDIAIPILNHSGISFYNPQVSSWYPELMKLENEAKDLANCLFFVIDSETRAVASLVEVAYLIAQGKNIILVITGISLPGTIICGEPITESEIQDLASSRTLIRQLSTRNNVRVFECIKTAVQTTAGLLRQHEEGSPCKSENGRVSKCRLIAASDCPNSTNPVTSSQLLPKEPTKFDVYLGGSCLTEDAIRHLRQSGLSSWTLTSADDKSSLLADPRTSDTTVLFFYLSSSARGLETLILAAYYVGLSKNVVLCIENLDDDCVIGEEALSQIAIKDYNRGRCYLREVAVRHNVPICSTLTEAFDAIVSKVRLSEATV